MLDICLLGTGGMMPVPGRYLTAMLARVDGKMLLIDCGEGTQVTMKMLGWGFKAIDVICFTHFHADHISGLPGILLTIGNAGRTEPLTLIGPSGLAWVTEGLRRIAPELPFPIKYIELTEAKGTISVGKYEISFLSVEHIVKCYAYRIDIKRRGKFDIQKATSLQVPKEIWSKLQKEEETEFEGKLYTSDMVLGQERKGIAVSYCTDTRPIDQLIPFIKGSDLFICEGMYGENEKKQKAIENKHMLFSEAARLALQGKVEKLWLTHFSPSVSEPSEFFENAHSIFPNTELGEDRKKITLFFPESV
ncbi:MAG: ribonuclease Z [Epulopiscium sp.]|jgi:ribonuclease Z|nr:ribonuclease Z [Candidatus Epulonipiscium sp.]